MKIQALSIRSGEKLLVKETVLILALTMILPFIFHLFPIQSATPIGAIFLPIFIAPFIGIVFFRFHVGLIAALLAPWLNYLLTGSPVLPVVSILCLELVVFVAIAYPLLKNNTFRWVAAPLAIILAKVISSLVLFISGGGEAFFVSLQKALMVVVPGILLLWVVNIVVLLVKK
ncbi:MAG: hypothetical protein GY705_02050 [Bacteroidetes bacterium]|nr:hypothetical protein [Bacteroidota bacterium]